MRYTERIFRNHSLVDDPALAKCVGEHAFDLLATLAGPTKDGAAVACGRGLRAARLMEFLAYIDGNIENPDLGVKMVAERQGISTRYVSRLMEDRGETLSHYILRRRLEKAIEMLAESVKRHLRIGDIAYACGFGDISHFNRAFKRRYGESPRSFRG